MTPIVNAFVTDPEAFDYAYTFSKVLISTSAAVGVLFLISNALQAAGAAKSALLINITRQGLVYIPLLFILKHTLGINGLVYTQPASDIITLTLALVVYWKVSKDFFPTTCTTT